jgi:hypothetical protein
VCRKWILYIIKREFFALNTGNVETHRSLILRLIYKIVRILCLFMLVTLPHKDGINYHKAPNSHISRGTNSQAVFSMIIRSSFIESNTVYPTLCRIRKDRHCIICVCVCVCVCARACVCVCVCVPYYLILKHPQSAT